MTYENALGFYDADRLGDMLFVFHKNHNKYFNDRLAQYDISLIHALCMLMIYEHGELNQKDLSNGLYITKGAITRAVIKLESGEWIVREKSKNDKRYNVLKLTKKGEDFIPILFGINDDWQAEMGLDSLEDDFMSTFNQLTLRAIDLNIKKE